MKDTPEAPADLTSTSQRIASRLDRMRPRPRTRVRSHPALEPPGHALSEAPGSLDKVVFGVTAVLSLAFIAWGILSLFRRWAP